MMFLLLLLVVATVGEYVLLLSLDKIFYKDGDNDVYVSSLRMV